VKRCYKGLEIGCSKVMKQQRSQCSKAKGMRKRKERNLNRGQNTGKNNHNFFATCEYFSHYVFMIPDVTDERTEPQLIDMDLV
jgi:hypothetical protein